MSKELLDSDGENRAVRMFLALYGGASGVTTDQMRKHLKMSGFDGAWPDWVNQNVHLTKGGAQLWLRHLFALERPSTLESNGGRTGWPPGLLQDDCTGLSKWLASKPDARECVRRALEQSERQEKSA